MLGNSRIRGIKGLRENGSRNELVGVNVRLGNVRIGLRLPLTSMMQTGIK